MLKKLIELKDDFSYRFFDDPAFCFKSLLVLGIVWYIILLKIASFCSSGCI